MKRAWTVRPIINDIDFDDYFKKNNVILTDSKGVKLGSTKMNINDTVAKYYEENNKKIEGVKLGVFIQVLKNFMKINEGDYAIIPNNDDISIYTVTKDPIKSVKIDGVEYFQRNIQNIKTISRDDLSKQLRSSLRVWRQIFPIDKFLNEIESIIRGNLMNDDTTPTITVTIPIRIDSDVVIKLPADITEAEAAKLGKTISTMYFT